MTDIAAIVACVVLAGLTVFQIALIAGAPIGRFAWGGAHTILPSRLRAGSGVSIVLYTLFALLILQRAGLVDVGVIDRFANAGIWVLVAYFTIGIGMNAISRSKPERAVMTPLAAILAITCLAVALN
jgi:hypothetical protein